MAIYTSARVARTGAGNSLQGFSLKALVTLAVNTGAWVASASTGANFQDFSHQGFSLEAFVAMAVDTDAWVASAGTGNSFDSFLDDLGRLWVLLSTAAHRLLLNNELKILIQTICDN